MADRRPQHPIRIRGNLGVFDAPGTPTVFGRLSDARLPVRLHRDRACERIQGRARQHADLADCRDLILIALESGHCRHDDSAHVTIDLAGVALTNILERQSDRGRWGCTGDELQALELLAEYSLDFWNRRSGALYYDAYQRLRTIRVEQARRLREAA